MLKRIRLELARTPDFPNGSSAHGYELIAPLDEEGHMHLSGLQKHGEDCMVRRFWQGEDDEHGEIIPVQDGWAFSYAPGDDDDEAIFRMSDHVFRPGEYISVTEHDGVTRPFRVVDVRALS